MSNQYGYGRSIPASGTDVATDVGLRKFMLGVYTKMGLGLLWSGVLAYAVGAYAPLTQLVFGTPLLFVVQWGPIALILAANFMMRNPSPAATGALYWSIVTLIGAGLGIWVYLAMSGATATGVGGVQHGVTFTLIAKAFLMTSIAFGGLSLWGYTTKKNLSGMDSFLVMIAWGGIAASLLNFFVFKSSALDFGLQFAMLAIFSLLVATRTNMLRENYFYMRDDQRGLAAMTNMGALSLYIAFVNMFQMLLSILSRR